MIHDSIHKPVLLNEVIEILDPKPGEIFVDGTIDGGGHAAEILRRISPKGILVGIDWDKTMIEKARQNISAISKSELLTSKIILVNDNYKNMKKILERENIGKANGIILDLGLSSEQLELSGRGFSFQKNEPLLMTYSDGEKAAYSWLEDLRESALFEILKELGEEKFAARIAKAIKKNLPIQTSKKLAEVVAGVVPRNYERGRIHPATRTFQALRIFVNKELDNLKQLLRDIPDILAPGGRLAIVSFHSLEDRIVKNEFRNFVRSGRAEFLNKKPITPSRTELVQNFRSRSAKLRALKVF